MNRSAAATNSAAVGMRQPLGSAVRPVRVRSRWYVVDALVALCSSPARAYTRHATRTASAMRAEMDHSPAGLGDAGTRRNSPIVPATPPPRPTIRGSGSHRCLHPAGRRDAGSRPGRRTVARRGSVQPCRGRLLHGVPPYLGAWDHKPPGIYLASAAVQAVLGWLGPWTADWLLSLAASVGIGVAVATVLARLGVTGWPRTLAAVGATILASHYLLALGGGLTEPPSTLLVAWALVLAVRPTTGARLAGIGALVGLSTLLSVQLLPGGLVVLALASSCDPPARGRGELVWWCSASRLRWRSSPHGCR